MASAMEMQLANVLSSKPVLLANPGQNLLNNSLYSTPHNTKLDLINQLVTRGRLKISTNSLSFGSSSTFQIPPGSFLSDCWLGIEVTTPQYACAPSGWLLNAISRIYYQVSGNSSINNVSLSGASHRDMVLFSCGDTDKRNAILKCSPYIDGTSAGGTYSAACPLYLPWSSPSQNGLFPIDTSALQSNLVITIEWKPFYQIFSGQTGHAIAGPTSMNSCFFKATQVDLLDGYAFKISNAMSMDPMLTYAIPTFLTQTYVVNQSVTPGVPGSISLSSLPQGQLSYILVSAKPLAWYGSSTTTASLIYPQSVEYTYLRLQHNGQDLIVIDNYYEKQLVDILDSNSSGFQYTYQNSTSLASGTSLDYNSSLCVLPLIYDTESAVLEKRYQHCPSYGGSVLIFDFNVAVTSLTPASAANYVFEFTYVFNAILEIQNKISSLVI